MRRYVFSLLNELTLSNWLWSLNRLCDDSLEICLNLLWFSLKALHLNILTSRSESTRRLCSSESSCSWGSNHWVLILFRSAWNMMCCLIQAKIDICIVRMWTNGWLRNVIGMNILRILNSISCKWLVILWLINSLRFAHHFNESW